MEEIEDLESTTTTNVTNSKRLGVFVCTVCKVEFQAERKRGTPVRICPICQHDLDSKGLKFCTTCRTPKPSEEMLYGKYRCKTCHYESIGAKDKHPCAQCHSVAHLIKYSKVCRSCFDKNDKAGKKFCVRCRNTVDKDQFGSSGNVCSVCLVKYKTIRISEDTMIELKEFVEKRSHSLTDDSFDAMIGFILLEAKRNEPIQK